MILILKIVVALSFVGVGLGLFRAWSHARKRFEDSQSIEAHRAWARKALWFTLGAVVVTEGMVRLIGLQATPLFWVHLSFAVSYSLLLVALQWMNGYRLSIHKEVGYACLAAYVGTFVTGNMLLYQV